MYIKYYNTYFNGSTKICKKLGDIFKGVLIYLICRSILFHPILNITLSILHLFLDLFNNYP